MTDELANQSNAATDAETDLLTDHAYDGIQEFDNPLPGWWKWLFIASIAISPVYWVFYHGGAQGRTIHDAYNLEMAEVMMKQFAGMGDLVADEQTIAKYLNDKNGLRVGQVVFKTHCQQCHGRKGEGKVGPNLTDEAFKNIKTLPDIAKVVNNGAAAGAMPAWSNRLHPNEVVLVSSYVASLRGLNAEGSKAPEGREIDPWPEYVEPEQSDAEATQAEASQSENSQESGVLT